MSGQTIRRVFVGALCASVVALATSPVANAAFDDPIYVFRPIPPKPLNEPKPPPTGDLEGPCGLAVDGLGRFYVSDYYRNQVDIFGSGRAYAGQITGIDSLDGPCGLAFDADGNLYVNDYHRNVLKFDPSFSSSTVLAGIGSAEETHPTGVAVNRANGTVYVDQRTGISVFGPTGILLGTLGTGTLADGYGMAVSEYPGSKGLVYVADAADEVVKVYAPEPLNSGAAPVAEIDGSATPLGHFVSLRDAAIAIDGESGQVYVADNLQPEYAERPEVVIYVFDAAGDYLGRLKYSIENAVPPGLAVDNSTEATQGRVYVTSGNTELAAVYAYAPNSATVNAVPVPQIRPTGPALLVGTGPSSVSSASDSAAPASPAPAAETAVGAAGVDRGTVKHRRAAKHRRDVRRHRAKQRRTTHRAQGRAQR